MLSRLIVLFIGLAALFGCSSISTNPSKGGFIGGVKGTLGGGYDKRIQAKENEITKLQLLNAQLQERLGYTKGKISGVNREILKVKDALKRSKYELARTRELLEGEQAKLLIDSETRDRLLQEQQYMETLMLELTLMTVELEKQERILQQNKLDEDIKSKIRKKREDVKKASERIFPQQEKFNQTIETLFNRTF